jgi:hypothetical protein
MSECNHEDSNPIFGWPIEGTMSWEFKELALGGHNYPTRVMGVKISLALRGMYEVITPPIERQQQLWESFSKVSEWESTLGWTPSEYWTSINLALKHAI